MKLKLDKTELLKALNVVTKVIPKNATLPVLEYMLFDFINESGTKYISLRASNLENTITYYLYTDFPDKMTNFLLMDPIKFKNFLLKIDTNDIELNVEVGILTAKANKNKMTFPLSNDIENFPKYPEVKEQNEITVNYKKFKSLINDAFIFSADDELRPVMNSIYINQLDGDDGFDIVSTNSTKLFRYTSKDFSTEASGIKIILSKSVKALLPNSNIENIEIKNGEKFIELVLDNIIIHSMKLENNYPSYNSVIPTNYSKKIILTRTDFINALDKSSLVGNVFNIIKMEITEEDIKITSENLESNNKFNTSLEVNSPVKKNDILTIGLNSKYLLEILKITNSEEIIIKYENPTKSILITTEEDEGLLILLMPMMLNQN